MLQLKYPERITAIKELEEQLTTLSLAYKATIDQTLNEPEIREGQTIVTGMENIIVYVNQLESEIRKSRNFAC